MKYKYKEGVSFYQQETIEVGFGSWFNIDVAKLKDFNSDSPYKEGQFAGYQDKDIYVVTVAPTGQALVHIATDNPDDFVTIPNPYYGRIKM